eukprot:XP_001692697.1 predicted protein [Chlamydomonas reinhardtii]
MARLRVLVLAGFMLFFGTINTLTTKFQDMTVVGVGPDGKPLTFNHPAVQSFFMFFGELLCLAPHFLGEWRLASSRSRVKRRQELQRRGPAFRLRRVLAFAAPACCDAVATTLLNIGLFYTYASTYQMLRGTLVLFAGFFTVTVLRRRLYIHHWLGMVLITGGAALLAALGSDPGVDAAAAPLFGDLCVVAAQAFTALQFILEEKFVADFRVPTLLAVGLEGLWGCGAAGLGGAGSLNEPLLQSGPAALGRTGSGGGSPIKAITSIAAAAGPAPAGGGVGGVGGYGPIVDHFKQAIKEAASEPGATIGAATGADVAAGRGGAEETAEAGANRGVKHAAEVAIDKDKTIEALVSTHLWAVYALDERNIACRPDLCNLATSTVELFGALPVHGSQFASRVARALLDAGLLDCYARIIAWFRARCAPAAATPISAPASAAAAEHDEDGYQRDVFSRWVKQACGLLQMMAHWTAHEHAAGMHAQLCAALERSQLLEHAAAALVTLATACAPAPLPSPPAGGTAAAGAASYAAAEPARGVASGDRAQPTSLRDQQAAKCWERVNNAVIRMMVAAAMLVDHCGLGSEMWPPHPHPGVLQALRPQAGSLQVAAQLRRVLSGRGVQLCLAWVLEAARPGVAEEPSVKPGVQGVRTPAVATPAGGSAGGSGARAAAVQQPPLAPAARWLPPALARPLVLSAHSSQGEKLDLSWVTAHIAASIWQLTASGPCVLPTAHPPHVALDTMLAMWPAFMQCSLPRADQEMIAVMLMRLLTELRPRQAAARLPAVWRVVVAVLPQLDRTDLAAVGSLLRLLLAGPDGSMLSCAAGGDAAAAPGGCSYSLRCALDAGLLPVLQRLLRNEKTLRDPGSDSPCAATSLSAVNLMLRYSGVWPALLAHASPAEAVGLVATLGSASRFFHAHNMPGMRQVSEGGLLCLARQWGAGGPSLALGCYLAAMLEQCVDLWLPPLLSVAVAAAELRSQADHDIGMQEGGTQEARLPVPGGVMQWRPPQLLPLVAQMLTRVMAAQALLLSGPDGADLGFHMDCLVQLLMIAADWNCMPELTNFLADLKAAALQHLAQPLLGAGLESHIDASAALSAAITAALEALAPAVADLAAAVRGSAWMQRLIGGQRWLLSPAEVQARLQALGIVLPDTPDVLLWRLPAGGLEAGPRQGVRRDGCGGGGWAGHTAAGKVRWTSAQSTDKRQRGVGGKSGKGSQGKAPTATAEQGEKGMAREGSDADGKSIAATAMGSMKRINDGRPHLGEFTLTCKGCEQELPVVRKVTPHLKSWDNGSNSFKKTVLFSVKCNKCKKNATALLQQPSILAGFGAARSLQDLGSLANEATAATAAVNAIATALPAFPHPQDSRVAGPAAASTTHINGSAAVAGAAAACAGGCCGEAAAVAAATAIHTDTVAAPAAAQQLTIMNRRRSLDSCYCRHSLQDSRHAPRPRHEYVISSAARGSSTSLSTSLSTAATATSSGGFTMPTVAPGTSGAYAPPPREEPALAPPPTSSPLLQPAAGSGSSLLSLPQPLLQRILLSRQRQRAQQRYSQGQGKEQGQGQGQGQGQRQGQGQQGPQGHSGAAVTEHGNSRTGGAQAQQLLYRQTLCRTSLTSSTFGYAQARAEYAHVCVTVPVPEYSMLQAFPGLSAERKNPRPTPPPASTAVRHGYSSFASAVATASGVGGGAIYIPLFNALIGFELKASTALSQACITAGSLAALGSNLHRRHPLRPEAWHLVDFRLMLVLTPVLLVGSSLRQQQQQQQQTQNQDSWDCMEGLPPPAAPGVVDEDVDEEQLVSGSLASGTGAAAGAAAVRRSGRPSLVVLALAGVMGAGCLSVGVFGLKQAVEDLEAGKIGFTGICMAR